jgi:hypothetical protein
MLANYMLFGTKIFFADIILYSHETMHPSLNCRDTCDGLTFYLKNIFLVKLQKLGLVCWWFAAGAFPSQFACPSFWSLFLLL